MRHQRRLNAYATCSYERLIRFSVGLHSRVHIRRRGQGGRWFEIDTDRTTGTTTDPITDHPSRCTAGMNKTGCSFFEYSNTTLSMDTLPKARNSVPTSSLKGGDIPVRQTLEALLLPGGPHLPEQDFYIGVRASRNMSDSGQTGVDTNGRQTATEWRYRPPTRFTSRVVFETPSILRDHR